MHEEQRDEQRLPDGQNEQQISFVLRPTGSSNASVTSATVITNRYSQIRM